MNPNPSTIYITLTIQHSLIKTLTKIQESNKPISAALVGLPIRRESHKKTTTSSITMSYTTIIALASLKARITRKTRRECRTKRALSDLA
jgi:hypothetical protein